MSTLAEQTASRWPLNMPTAPVLILCNQPIQVPPSGYQFANLCIFELDQKYYHVHAPSGQGDRRRDTTQHYHTLAIMHWDTCTTWWACDPNWHETMQKWTTFRGQVAPTSGNGHVCLAGCWAGAPRCVLLEGREAVLSHARGRRPRECHHFFCLLSVCVVVGGGCACPRMTAGWPSRGFAGAFVGPGLSGRSVQSVRPLSTMDVFIRLGGVCVPAHGTDSSLSVW